MRALAIAFLLLASCDRNRGANETAIEASPAEISFDGAEAKVGAARVAHGERISWALGCRGCHGPELQGHYFYERYASNLTRDLSKYSDTEIDRVLRTGVPHGGRDLWGMPSEIFQHLSTADMRALIADLRTLKPSGQPTQAPLPWETDAKAMIAKGELRTAKDQVIHDKSIGPVDLGERYALGRYLTRVTCAGRTSEPHRRGRLVPRRIRGTAHEGHPVRRTQVQEPADGRGRAQTLHALHAARTRRNGVGNHPGRVGVHGRTRC